MRKLWTLLFVLLPSFAVAGTHVQQNDPGLTIGSMTVLGPMTVGGASPVLSTSSLQTGATFYVSSGTVSGNFYGNTIYATGISNGQCLQTGPGGQITGTGSICVAPGQNLLISSSTYSGQNQWITPAQSTFTYGLSVGSMTITSFASGQCVQSGAGGLLTLTGSSCASASSGLLASTQTWTGQNNWTTPAQSTFTYGLTVGSFTINGSSAGALSLTEGLAASVFTSAANKDIFWADSSSHAISGTFNGSTSSFTFVVSSVTPVAGQFAQWTPTGPHAWTLGTATAGGTPGGTAGSVQVSSSGFSGSTKFQVVASSVQINNGTVDSTAYQNGLGVLDVYTNIGTGSNILTLGSLAQGSEVEFQEGTMTKFNFGYKNNCTGFPSTTEAWTELCNSGTQLINLWSSGNMILQTDSGSGGKDILFQPNQTLNLRVSNTSGMTVVSSETIQGVGGSKIVYGVTAGSVSVVDTAATSSYSAQFSSYTANFQIAITTNGDIVSNSSNTAMGTCGTSPSVVGDNNEGIITVGGGVVTSCTMNFANAGWGAGCNVVCNESDNSTTVTGDVSALSSTSVTFSFSATLGGGLIYYQCRGYGSACK